MVTTVAGNGLHATFSGPKGLALDGAGNLYVADYGDNEIRQIELSTGTTTVLAGLASKASGHANGAGSAASFSGPSGLVYDGAGNLYVTDSGNQTVRKVALAGATVSTPVGPSGTAPLFDLPQDLAYDGKGNLYLTCSGDATVRLIDVFTFAVSTELGIPWVQGLETSSLPGLFNDPHGIALVPTRFLFISDFNENVVVEVTGK
jgi:DNA-binding beta-propeller fold protein YncE